MDKIKIGKEVLEIMNDMYYDLLPRYNDPQALIEKAELKANIRTLKSIIEQEEKVRQEEQN